MAGFVRLVCLLRTLTGLDRCVAASEGTQHQVNRQGEAALVTYRHEASAWLAQDMPAKAITLAKDETFTGGLCLVAMAPQSHSSVLEQTAQGHDQDTWHALMEKALSGLNGQVLQSTRDEAPGLLAYVAHHSQPIQHESEREPLFVHHAPPHTSATISKERRRAV